MESATDFQSVALPVELPGRQGPVVADAGGATQQRFWKKVEKTEACWNWLGGVNSAGYGSFGLITTPRVKTVLSHRYAFELANGPIPGGSVLLHSCDNRRCVNPAHLSAGSVADNNHDMVSKGRHR